MNSFLKSNIQNNNNNKYINIKRTKNNTYRKLTVHSKSYLKTPIFVYIFLYFYLFPLVSSWTFEAPIKIVADEEYMYLFTNSMTYRKFSRSNQNFVSEDSCKIIIKNDVYDSILKYENDYIITNAFWNSAEYLFIRSDDKSLNTYKYAKPNEGQYVAFSYSTIHHIYKDVIVSLQLSSSSVPSFLLYYLYYDNVTSYIGSPTEGDGKLPYPGAYNIKSCILFGELNDMFFLCIYINSPHLYAFVFLYSNAKIISVQNFDESTSNYDSAKLVDFDRNELIFIIILIKKASGSNSSSLTIKKYKIIINESRTIFNFESIPEFPIINLPYGGNTFSAFMINSNDLSISFLIDKGSADSHNLPGYTLNQYGPFIKLFSGINGLDMGTFFTKKECEQFGNGEAIKYGEKSILLATNCKDSTGTVKTEVFGITWENCTNINVTFTSSEATVDLSDPEYLGINIYPSYKITRSIPYISEHLTVKISDGGTNEEIVELNKEYNIYYQKYVKFIIEQDKIPDEGLKVFYRIKNGGLTSVQCHFLLKALKNCCDSCNGCSSNCDLENDIQNCNECNKAEGYYPLEDHLTQCYKKNTEKTEGYYFSESEEKFIKCPTGCKKCTSEQNCNECEEQYVLSELLTLLPTLSNCVPQCTSNIYKQNPLYDTTCITRDDCISSNSVITFDSNGIGECRSNCNYKNYLYKYDGVCYDSSCEDRGLYIKSTDLIKTEDIDCYSTCPISEKFHKEGQYICYSTCPNDCLFYNKNNFECTETDKGDDYKSVCGLTNEYYDPILLQCASICSNTLVANEDKSICKNANNKTEDNNDINDITEKTSKEDIQNIISNNLNEFVKNKTVIETETYVISASKSGDKANNKAATIDLGNCKDILKERYQTDDFYIGIIELKSSSVCYETDYEIYLSNGTKVDKSICDGSTITVSTPIRNTDKIDMNKASSFANEGIDVFNHEDDFFQDICYTYVTNSSTDATLQNREDAYYQNVTFCEDGCTYEKVDYTSTTAQCVCFVDTSGTISESPKTSSDEENELKNENAFLRAIRDSNLKVAVCYKLVFCFNFFVNNYGGMFMLLLILIQIICLIIFNCRGLKSFKILIETAFSKANKKENNQNTENKENINTNNNENNIHTNANNENSKESLNIKTDYIADNKINVNDKEIIINKRKKKGKERNSKLKSNISVTFSKKDLSNPPKFNYINHNTENARKSSLISEKSVSDIESIEINNDNIVKNRRITMIKELLPEQIEYPKPSNNDIEKSKTKKGISITLTKEEKMQQKQMSNNLNNIDKLDIKQVSPTRRHSVFTKEIDIGQDKYSKYSKYSSPKIKYINTETKENNESEYNKSIKTNSNSLIISLNQKKKNRNSKLYQNYTENPQNFLNNSCSRKKGKSFTIRYSMNDEMKNKIKHKLSLRKDCIDEIIEEDIEGFDNIILGQGKNGYEYINKDNNNKFERIRKNKINTISYGRKSVGEVMKIVNLANRMSSLNNQNRKESIDSISDFNFSSDESGSGDDEEIKKTVDSSITKRKLIKNEKNSIRDNDKLRTVLFGKEKEGSSNKLYMISDVTNTAREGIKDEKEYENKVKIINKKSQKTNIEDKILDSEFNKYELNYMDYELAIIYDKRSFCKMYIDIVSVMNNIIYTFCSNDTFSLKVISLSLFFFSICMSMSINCLFYDDESVSYNFIMEGVYTITHELPQCIYSFLISFIINIILSLLTSIKNRLLYIRIYKADKDNWDINKILKCHKIQLIIYFIIIFILELLFSYYIAAFCAVYSHNQKGWFLDSLISFGFDFLTSFILSLIATIFRYSGIINKNSCMYCISDYMI